MSKTYGFTGLTPGSYVHAVIDSEAVTCLFGNDSPYDLYIFFGSNPPAPITAIVSLAGQYHGVVHAGDRQVLPVSSSVGASVAERQLNTIGRFSGDVYMLPVDTRTPATASSGTISAVANLYITAFGPYDPAPLVSSSPRSTDLSSQPRVIAVPPSPSAYTSGIIGWTSTTGPQTINLFTQSVSIASASGLMTPPPGQSHWDGSSRLTVYIHYLKLQLAHRTGQTAYPAYVIGEFGICDMDIGNNIVGSSGGLLKWQVGSELNMGVYEFTPQMPLAYGGYQPSSTTYNTWFYINLSVISAQPGWIFYTILATGDNINRTHVPPIGQNGATFITSTSDPAIY